MCITVPVSVVTEREAHSTSAHALPPAACLEGYRSHDSHAKNVSAACGCLRHTTEPRMARDIRVLAAELSHYYYL